MLRVGRLEPEFTNWTVRLVTDRDQFTLQKGSAIARAINTIRDAVKFSRKQKRTPLFINASPPAATDLLQKRRT